MEGLPEISDLVARSNQVYEEKCKTTISQFVVSFKQASDLATQQGEFMCDVRMPSDPSVIKHIMLQLTNKGYTVDYNAIQNFLKIHWSRT